MAIRNTCVARGTQTTNTATTVYTVPPGNALILKSLVVSDGTGTQQTATLSAVDTTGTHGVYVAILTVPASATASWSGWMVLNAGDYLTFRPSGAGLNYWISGAVLPYATP